MAHRFLLNLTVLALCTSSSIESKICLLSTLGCAMLCSDSYELGQIRCTTAAAENLKRRWDDQRWNCRGGHFVPQF